ncbi:bifunctional MaoC family dehydratase N-terminal/OB-fold nucleic acid binding domain-containing protein [Planomonospora sp. ID82291]|uniref:bifunctional MaoC family dehydratase N-terminal/OB-fold nucleic acid binding domain-containing protein n=1 Tax=Planomonospora sp. ID82291 TaxID=2738136 RepID=UPI0018C40AC0|nr:OB-fold domain-containing protein [Planomonospora sp. ID82291]MBG0817922.1 MaoC family dehydratase N-terminal domain-containing protein [Planomonospora sp. ID82291]
MSGRTGGPAASAAPGSAAPGDRAGDYEERLQAFTGRELTPLRPGPDPVNLPMIRHWAEAMEDGNPVHLDEAAARATGRPGVVAPASMVQVWTMPGYAATVTAPSRDRAGEVYGELLALLEEGGYTSVVATDSEFEFRRELVPGDRVGVEEVVESVSPEKTTALGAGRFVTTLKTYRDGGGEVVAVQRWRILWFDPARRRTPAPDGGARERAGERAGKPAREPGGTPAGRSGAPRPRPALNRDNAFWFEAAREHRLVIQRCAGCETLRHPPGPCCPRCGSFDWDTVEASGRGHVYSYVVNHHPRHPAFAFPLLVALVELAEGTRLITGLAGVAPEAVEIGMPVVLDWIDPDPDLSLPVFRPAEQEEQ